MSEKRLTDMDYAEFQGVMDSYIARSAQQDDAIPAPTFLELLFNALLSFVSLVPRKQPGRRLAHSRRDTFRRDVL